MHYYGDVVEDEDGGWQAFVTEQGNMKMEEEPRGLKMAGNGGIMHIGLSDETIEAMAETAKMKKTHS